MLADGQTRLMVVGGCRRIDDPVDRRQTGVSREKEKIFLSF
jgi:hypothetical protein